MSCADADVGFGSKPDVPAAPSDAGFLRLDAELGIVSLDENAGRLIEMRPEILLGRKVGDVFDLDQLGDLMKSGISFSGQTVSVKGRRILCDYVPITEGTRIVGGVLTLLKLLPEHHPDSSDQLKELLSSADQFLSLDYDGIVVVDREGIVVMVNQAFADVLDTSPQAMIGKHVSQAYPNSQPSRLPGVMEANRPLIGITHYLNGKQVYASLFPLVRDGKVVGGIGKILFKDIREITLLANRLKGAPETRPELRTAIGTEPPFKYDLNSIIGQSASMMALKETLLRVAQKSSNVLLLGESGTGKELFAHAIHAASNRRFAPFVKVNCAAIPENLLESELFGYSDGAFTGARKGGQLGKFEQAHTGTIFLDEIGDMPLYMQAKLLRVLQERELTQLGSTKPKLVDVRVVAATNSNLEQLVREGRFREDLYYRLKVVTLTIPPLRERMEDLYPLTATFINKFNADFGLEIKGLNPDAWDVLRRYQWPGNIRELRNVIESAFNCVTGPVIGRQHLPTQLSQQIPRAKAPDAAASPEALKEFICANLGKKDLTQIMDAFEKHLLDAALEVSHGNKLHAAQLLGISRQWLYKKLQKHGDEEGE